MIEQAEALAAQLDAAGMRAGVDPAWADVNRPCVLVTPPTINYADRSVTWRLAALSSHPAGSLDAWAQLHDLVETVADVLDVETAEPASYALTPASGPVPAYLIRVTTSH